MIDDTLPVDRKTAKTTGSKFYFTGVACKRGHMSPRQSSDAACTECKREQGRENKEYHREYYQKNRETALRKSSDRYLMLKKQDPDFNKRRYKKTIDTHREYREKNREARKAYCAVEYKKNVKQRLAYALEYRARTVEQRREYAKNRYPLDRDYYFAQAAKRRAAKCSATPNWLTEDHLEKIQKIYSKRNKAQVLTGVEHHVDHIVPLRNDKVCGLHVPWNLQVLTARENLSKSNKFSSGGA